MPNFSFLLGLANNIKLKTVIISNTVFNIVDLHYSCDSIKKNQ